MKITNTIPNPTIILRFWKWGLLALVAVAFTLTLAQSSTPRTEAGVGDVPMSLVVKGAGTDCRSDTQVVNCQILKGSKFTVSIDLKQIPAPYNGFQALVTWSGQLAYQKAASVSNEIKWPDCDISARQQEPKGPGSVLLGCIVFFNPDSTFVGNIVNLEFFCDPALSGKGVIDLVPFDPVLQTSGSFLSVGSNFIPALPAQLNIECGIPMSLVVKTAGPDCRSDTQVFNCVINKGSKFTVSIDLKQIPGPHTGFQTLVTWSGQLTYQKTASEIKLPGCEITGRFQEPKGPGSVQHFCAVIFGPPINSVGNMVNLEFFCDPALSGKGVIDLVPFDPVLQTSGSGLFVGTNTLPALPAQLRISCGKLPDPGDTDGDGCSDVRENGTNPALGGLRDWLNPNDYFDVNGDRHIDVPNDILPVILAYLQGPLDPGGPGPLYTAAKDRGPAKVGALFAWHRTGPDGHIDVPNDLLPIILQYLHTCKP